jgi:KDO2-lipid IV(A) lauroyltransferase
LGRRRSALGQALGFVPSALALGIARALPYRARVGFGGWLGRRLVGSLPRFRRRVEANLAHVMPGLAHAEREAIIRGVGDTFGRSFVEIFSMAEFQRQAVWRGPSGDGVEPLLAAIRSGRGAVIVTGHIGQWEAGRAWLKAEGVECAGVYRPLNNSHLERIYRRHLEAGGRPMFVKGGRGLREMVGHLRRGGTVALLIDQYEKRAPKLDFLGQPAPSTTVAAELAIKFGIPMVPAYGIRDPDGMHIAVIIEPPIPPSDPLTMTEAFNASLAARIRAHPGQYLWLHRRWRKDLPDVS